MLKFDIFFCNKEQEQQIKTLFVNNDFKEHIQEFFANKFIDVVSAHANKFHDVAAALKSQTFYAIVTMENGKIASCHIRNKKREALECSGMMYQDDPDFALKVMFGQNTMGIIIKKFDQFTLKTINLMDSVRD